MKYLGYTVTGLLALIVAGLLAASLWMLIPYPVEQGPIDRALLPDSGVEIAREPYLVFRPTTGHGQRGLIFYPGGKTRPSAYAPLLRKLAEAGLLVVAVPMPLNTPLLGSGMASQVMEEFTGISDWYLAGHSLGGVAAALYARDHEERLAGLVLWAAYPAVDISSASLDVLSIYARDDLRTTPREIALNRSRLPPSTIFEEIDGNHWQFGYFAREQDRRPPAVSAEQQQAAILAATLAFTGR